MMFFLLMIVAVISVSLGETKLLDDHGCSKYDFETRVLEKWIHLKNDLDGVKKRITGFERQTTAKVAVVIDEIAKLAESFEEFKSNPKSKTLCEDGWVVFQGACYLFLNRPSTFQQAKELCIQHSAHLVHIDGSEENNFLRNYVLELKPANHWIAISDAAVEGTWRWMDTEETLTYTDWHPGQPNGGRGSNCGALWRQYGYHWVDEPCTYKYRPICKRRS